MQTYLFYDLETTGLNKAFDQILQFAAIRTDAKLNELERYELNVKLNPDCIPSPGALLTHQLSIRDTQEGISEYNAVKQIHQWLNEPGTISLGYNTLNFDDEFLRFSFFRNLLPPYTHQYANQCTRMDIYPMTVMYYLFKNQTLNWPELNHKVSLKLADLNTANLFARGQAHHAMVDVEVTLALAKRLLQQQDMWDYLLRFFNKQLDQNRIRELKNNPTLLIDGQLGYEQRYMSPVYSLGFHHHYKNQSLWLRLDTADFASHANDELIKNTWVKNKKMGEPGFLLPLKDRYSEHLNPERLSLMEKNQIWLQKNPQSMQTLIDHYANYTYPVYPNTAADASLYLNGFWSDQEANFCRIFHAASVQEKAKLAEKIQHPILSALTLRLLGRHFPETLSPAQTERYSLLVAETSVDYKGQPRLTAKIALQQIEEIRDNGECDAKQLHLLQELEAYLKK